MGADAQSNVVGVETTEASAGLASIPSTGNVGRKNAAPRAELRLCESPGGATRLESDRE